MIRFANLLQAPTLLIYQLAKTITFVLYLFDMAEISKMEKKNIIIKKECNQEKSKPKKTTKVSRVIEVAELVE